jgi:TetR/AcrR family transcriptional repressor of nem operon
VLDAAMQRFWTQGCEGTSVPDLAAKMGVTGGSFCAAFGGKRTLYRWALEF